MGKKSGGRVAIEEAKRYRAEQNARARKNRRPRQARSLIQFLRWGR